MNIPSSMMWIRTSQIHPVKEKRKKRISGCFYRPAIFIQSPKNRTGRINVLVRFLYTISLILFFHSFFGFHHVLQEYHF